MQAMQNREDEIHLLDYWKVLRKRRQVAVTFFALVVGIVLVYSFAATPVYRGTAQVLIELEKNPVMTFSEGGGAVVQMRDSAEYYRTQVEILKSRAFGDRVVRKLQLDRDPYFLELKRKQEASLANRFRKAVASLFPAPQAAQRTAAPAAVQEELDKDITDTVLRNMEIELGRGSNILKVHYDSRDPGIAAGMANGIAATYIEHNLDIRVKPFRDSVEWLSARLVESKSRVEDSQKVLQKYKEGEGIVSFEAKENVITQKLQELTTQLVQAEAKRQEAEVRYRQIQSVVENPELLATVPDIMNNLVIQGLRNDELATKKKLSELAEKFGPKHPQMIKGRIELDTIQKNLVSEARKMLNAAKTDFDIAQAREGSIRKAIEEQKREVLHLSRKAIEFDVYAGEAVSNRQFYELLLKRLQEASLSSGINVSNAQIVDGASVPERPLRPRKALNLVLAMIMGSLGGVFAAFFVEYMDSTVKTPEDVEQVLALPFLGYVPSAGREEGPLYMFSEARAVVAESYRTIRTGVLLSAAEDRSLQVIVVTSAMPGEGKTTTSANLAVAMAQMGERVLIIDTDMRRHNLHRTFSMDNLMGISDSVVDHQNLDAALRTVRNIGNLDIITGGTMPPNPSELLGSNSMRELLARLRQRYDRIILDSPPMMLFSDALVMSKLADGVIIVVRAGGTDREVIRKASQSLKAVNARIIGTVLNNVNMEKQESSYYYGSSYGSYYGSAKGSKAAKKES
jgi:capsular exopolysaccharide synthesis family protein